MKKQLTVIGLILIASIIGVISFWQLVLRKDDVSWESRDYRVVFTLKGVTKEEPWQTGKFQVSFRVANGVNIYEEYVKDNEYFIGFIDESHNLVEVRTNRYLFCQDKQYFYLYEEGNVATLCELTGAYFPPNGTNGYFHIPYSGSIPYDQVQKLTYTELIGVSSYEDLVEYYSRVDSDKYEIDEENRCIYLSLYDWKNLAKKAVKLTVLEDGIEVELMEEYREKRVE